MLANTIQALDVRHYCLHSGLSLQALTGSPSDSTMLPSGCMAVLASEASPATLE